VFDPQTYNKSTATIWALDDAGRFKDEIDNVRAQLVHWPRDSERLFWLCKAYAATGHVEEGRAIEERLRSLHEDRDSRSILMDCQWYLDIATGNNSDALRVQQMWESRFPDNVPFPDGQRAGDFAIKYVLMGDFDKASDWFERAYESGETFFKIFSVSRGFGYEKAIEKYRLTAGYKALAAKPLFKAWQAEHDRIAAAFAAHRDPLN
jgi:tetratricopeptide (TPR) repeat protein